MSKFTARQWEYAERSGVIFAEDKGIAKVYGASTLMRDYTCEGAANARLIASAPEMYEAIKNLIGKESRIDTAEALLDAFLELKILIARIDGEDGA